MSTKVLKTNFNVTSVKNFRESLGRTTPDPEYLYLFFGKTTAWPDESNPNTAKDSVNAEFTARDGMFGIKRINKDDTVFIVPRIDWTSGTVYTQYDENEEMFTNNFYVITSTRNVYKCLDNNSDSESTVEPTGTISGNIFTGDGYTWKFMYNLTEAFAARFMTNDWMPVPYDSNQKTSFQKSAEINADYSSGEPVDGHASSAIYELGATRIMIAQNLNKDNSEFPTNISYRQFGLWLNPKLNNGNNADQDAYIVNDTNSIIDTYSGRIIYLENFESIDRNIDQAETFKVIIKF